ncbi:MAG: DNA-binding protein [Desulfobulbus propionicus]|nr:MAG: DNA-binding protein [Desulfobulbus propionicus]
MTTFSFARDTPWKCAACDQELVPTKLSVTYLHSEFHVELMACPQCKMTLVDEELAAGKMFEVEQLLEDK